MRKVLILSWLPSQEYQDQKDVIIIEVGESGYTATDWVMSGDDIIKRNAQQGFTEIDRISAECGAMK